jgi:Antitoxin VbhA
MTLNDREQLYRQQAVANAIATVRLAGMEIDSITLADLERVARGEITTTEALIHLRKRIAAGEFRDPTGPATSAP